MGYQNVATPRFYINTLEWLGSVGYRPVDRINRTLPVVQEDWSATYTSDMVGIFNDKMFAALLGHTFSGNYYDLYLPYGTGGRHTIKGLVNADSGNISHPQYPGFCIIECDEFPDEDAVSIIVSPATKVGSVIIGTYYDMPQNPNLSLSLSYEYDGVKHITTKGGNDLVDSRYTKSPMWGDLAPWELDFLSKERLKMRKTGRRVWNLKFSYVDDGDLWGSNQSLMTQEWGWYPWGSTYPEDPDGDLHPNYHTYNFDILDDINFYSQVWHRTNNGVLPFIFQPDNKNFQPDQFAICRFRDNSLKATQSAPNVYDISLTIEEVW